MTSSLVLENREIVFPNFRGIESKYNAEGNRNFCIVIEEDEVETLLNDGWNVRELSGTEDRPPMWFLQIRVNFASRRPPRIWKIRNEYGDFLRLLESDVDMLDYIPIESVDLEINPSKWAVQGRTGIKAYLEEMFVIPRVSRLERKWQAWQLEHESLDEEDLAEVDIVMQRILNEIPND